MGDKFQPFLLHSNRDWDFNILIKSAKHRIPQFCMSVNDFHICGCKRPCAAITCCNQLHALYTVFFSLHINSFVRQPGNFDFLRHTMCHIHFQCAALAAVRNGQRLFAGGLWVEVSYLSLGNINDLLPAIAVCYFEGAAR